MACPRGNPNAARYAYAYPPAADGLSIRRIKRFSSANRVISALEGTIDSCNEVSGNVVGPSNGLSRIEGIIGGCIRDNNGGDAACSSAVLDFLGGGDQSQDIQSATFTMQRVADTVTCEQIRGMNF